MPVLLVAVVVPEGNKVHLWPANEEKENGLSRDFMVFLCFFWSPWSAAHHDYRSQL